MTLRHRIFAYSILSFGFSLLSSVFAFYYVKVFLNYFNIEQSWFQFAQLLYLIWNMINDPLFAYIQDTTNYTITKTRRESILYTAPLFSLSFLVTWFPWAKGTWVTGLHLVTALCVYDTMFTYIGLAYCCLHTEISSDPNVRLQLTKWANVGSLLASSSIFLCEFMSDSLTSFPAFQWTTVVLSVIAAICMMYAGVHAHTEHDLKQQLRSTEKQVKLNKTRASDSSIWLLTWQILSNRNFLSFVITNFCQMFHLTFYSNFVAIVCDELIPDEVLSSDLRKTFYGSVHVLSGLVVIFGVPIAQKVGYYRVVKWTFVWKICSAVLMLCLGRHYVIIMILFILFDDVLSHAAAKLFNMPLSDIADEDMEKYNRSHPISSMVYGTNALVTKPAQSLNPMITVAILNSYGYREHITGTLGTSELDSLKDIIFLLLCCYSIILGLVQLTSWSMFVLRPRRWTEIHVLPNCDPSLGTI